MSRSIAVACVWLVTATGSATDAASRAARFVDPIQGFSVEVAALGEAGGAPVLQRLSVSGVPEDGFATNCNVQVQFASMSLEAYRDLSSSQFAEMGFEVHRQKERTVSGRPAVTFEYSGELSGRKLRFASLAVGGEDRFWLLTCTALAEKFERHRAEFAEVIDSFSLVERAKPG